jgi:hypothetical protein
MLPVFLVTGFFCETSNFHVNIGGLLAMLSVLFFYFRTFRSRQFIFCGGVLFSHVADLFARCYFL